MYGTAEVSTGQCANNATLAAPTDATTPTSGECMLAHTCTLRQSCAHPPACRSFARRATSLPIPGVCGWSSCTGAAGVGTGLLDAPPAIPEPPTPSPLPTSSLGTAGDDGADSGGAAIAGTNMSTAAAAAAPPPSTTASASTGASSAEDGGDGGGDATSVIVGCLVAAAVLGCCCIAGRLYWKQQADKNQASARRHACTSTGTRGAPQRVRQLCASTLRLGAPGHPRRVGCARGQHDCRLRTCD